MRRLYIHEILLHWVPTLSFALIFYVVLQLYRLPAEPLLYGLALSLALWILIAVLRYRRWVRRRNAVRKLPDTPYESVAELLPPAGSAIEAEYQALTRSLCRRLSEAETAAATEKRELNEYYTLWAHQIKTPIAAMRLLVQTEPEDCGEKLQGELLRIEQYVEMALRVLRLDEAESDLSLSLVKLDPFLKQSVRRFARLFILKKLRLDLEPTGITLRSDPKWLSFLVEQLLSNAVKYTPAGGCIRIYGAGSTLYIEDTGIGISAEDLPRVFEKGFTGYNGHEDRRSTGIGLYLCRRICTVLGCTLRLESQQGRGTKAILELGQEEREYE